MRRALLLPVFAGLLFAASAVHAEEATKADPKHYTVVFENEHVRVVRIKYGAHEKSVMHDHAGGLVVSVTDSRARMTTPDGKSVESSSKAGDVTWSDAVSHLPENLTDQPTETILIEIK